MGKTSWDEGRRPEGMEKIKGEKVRSKTRREERGRDRKKIIMGENGEQIEKRR